MFIVLTAQPNNGSELKVGTMILCCGEALIDMVPSTAVGGSPCFIPKSGGAVFNTAIALGRLGSDVGLLAGVSDDLFGRLLQDELAASKVQSRYLVTRALPSSLAFVELNKGQAQYTFYTENAADPSLVASDVPRDLSAVKAMFFGGISLCTDPTATTLHDLMRTKSDDCLTMIDPNIRTEFVGDEKNYNTRLRDMINHCDILKISDEDLNWLVPEADNSAAQMSILNKNGCRLTFLTKGAKGATAYLGNRQIAHAAAVPSEVVDTIGAGDTFNAAILHVFERHNSLNKTHAAKPEINIVQMALDFAVKAAAITVSRKGANPPWPDELL